MILIEILCHQGTLCGKGGKRLVLFPSVLIHVGALKLSFTDFLSHKTVLFSWCFYNKKKKKKGGGRKSLFSASKLALLFHYLFNPVFQLLFCCQFIFHGPEVLSLFPGLFFSIFTTKPCTNWYVSCSKVYLLVSKNLL